MKSASMAETIAEAEAQSLVMPERFDDWFAFAHRLHGYAIAEELGYADWGELYKQLRERYKTTGQWEGTAIELRCALFFYARGLKFMWYHEDIEYFNFIDSLLAAIAQRLGLPYQQDGEAQQQHAEKTEALANMSPEEQLADMGIRFVRPDDQNADDEVGG